MCILCSHTHSFYLFMSERFWHGVRIVLLWGSFLMSEKGFCLPWVILRVLQSMGLQRVGHDWATELNWTDVISALCQGIRMSCPWCLCPGSWTRRPLLFPDSWPVLLPTLYPLMLQFYFIVLFPKQVYVLYVIDYMYVKELNWKMSWESFRKKLASFKVQLSIPSLPWNPIFLGAAVFL